MNFDTLKFRASQCGKLMTDPRSKSETISETTKTYLVELMIEKVYKRRREIFSKYLQKGTMVEEDAITLLSLHLGEMLRKNEENFRNDFITGTPDIITQDCIYDTKSSWDIWSFWKTKLDPTNKDYYWQMQSYMDLAGKDNAYLVYCLVDTPDFHIESAKRKAMWDAGIKEAELPESTVLQIETNMKFSDIPTKDRINIIHIQRNNDDIERLHNRIMDCRKWMNENFAA